MLSGIRKLFSGEQSELKVKDVRDFISSNLGKELLLAQERLKAEIRKAAKELAILRQMYGELGSQGSKPDYPGSVKAKLCRRATELLDISEPEADHDGVLQFIRLSEDRLKSIGSIGYKEMIHLYAFKSDMQKIAAQTKQLISSLNSLAEHLDSSFVKKIDAVEKCAERIERNRNLREETKAAAESAENAAAERRRLLEGKVKSLKEFSEIEEELNSLQLDIEKAEAEMRFLDSKISEEFSGIEKLLKRYKHLRKEKGVVDEYIKNPSNAFLFLDKELEIKEILDGVAAEESLRAERKFEKALQLRRGLDLLASLRGQHEALAQKKSELEEKILKLSADASDKEYKLGEIQEIEAEIRRLESSKAETEEEIKSLNAAVKGDTLQLSALFRELTGKKIVLAE